MIVYQESCETFMADVRESNIDFVIYNQFQQKLHHRTSESEVNSWKNSMQYMKNVLEVADVPRDAMVTIECQIPQTSKRIDFILTGLDEKKHIKLENNRMQDSYAEAIIPLGDRPELRNTYDSFLKYVRFGRLLEDLDTMAGDNF